MDKKKIIIVVTCFALLLVLLTFLSFKILSTNKIEVVEVLVAKETIYPRTKITEYNTVAICIPKVFITDNVLMDKKDIIGRYTGVYALIPKGSMFFSDTLEVQENLSDYPALLLKKGQISYSIMSDVAKSGGNSLVAGQKVDLYASITIKDQLPVTDCLIKAVRITAIKDRNGLDITNEKSNGIPYVILIAVDESLVKYLKTAVKIGTIELYAVNTNYKDQEESILQSEALVLPYLQT